MDPESTAAVASFVIAWAVCFLFTAVALVLLVIDVAKAAARYIRASVKLRRRL